MRLNLQHYMDVILGSNLYLVQYPNLVLLTKYKEYNLFWISNHTLVTTLFI